MKRSYSTFLALLTIGLLAACDTAPPAREDWRHPDSTASYPLKPGTQWVAESEGWKQEAYSAYRNAWVSVAKAAKGRPKGSWAVVFDIDETVLSNIEYFKMRDRKGAEFTPGTWRDWVEERSAEPVPEVFAFMYRVKALGGHVAFVTNRMDYERQATIDNLSVYGFVYGREYDVLLTRAWPDGDSNKDARYAEVEQLLSKEQGVPVTTLAYIGDQWTDRPSVMPKGVRYFCVPQGNLYGKPCELEGAKSAAH